MKLPVILLFLQLWGNVEVSSQNVCAALPDVPHALVSEDTKKTEYHEGDVIHFSCEPGYTSSQISKYVCTSEGWLAVRRGTCYSCSTLPDVPHALVSEDTKKTEYQEGDVIHFSCEPGYTSSQISKYVCTSEGWLAVHRGTCYFPASGCSRPPADGGITIKGLPENDDPMVPDHIITFSCDDPGKYLSGSSLLICGEDGQWNKPFPSCEDITCKLEVMHSHLFVAGLPPATEKMKVGHKLRFQCNDPYSLDGSEEIECLPTGQWNTPFPTCDEGCQIPPLPRGVHIITYVLNNRLKIGQHVRFACSQPGDFLRGNEVVRCSEGGQWSDPFPTCGRPLGCEKPPGLEDGDTKHFVRYSYSHGERVEYACQRFYTMEGQRYKTCTNGQWTGDMRCLKPCTVNEDVKSRHNIDFLTSHEKLYVPHNDHITFVCRERTRHDGRLAMRQRCVDGVINFPTCI